MPQPEKGFVGGKESYRKSALSYPNHKKDLLEEKSLTGRAPYLAPTTNRICWWKRFLQGERSIVPQPEKGFVGGKESYRKSALSYPNHKKDLLEEKSLTGRAPYLAPTTNRICWWKRFLQGERPILPQPEKGFVGGKDSYRESAQSCPNQKMDLLEEEILTGRASYLAASRKRICRMKRL